MTKNDVINEIKGFKQTIQGTGNEVSDTLIQMCISIVDKMTCIPCVRPIINDEIYGTGIAFDYNESDGGFSVEIVVTENNISGYITYNNSQSVSFSLDAENDFVNFWNIIIGKIIRG